MMFAAGGDPKHKALPDEVPDPIARIIKFCVLESPLSRAQDAWEIYRRLDQVRQELWGPHQFLEFRI
jgi:hypothetical protein